MFELSEDHESFRKVVREFALAEVAPHAARWDREHALPVSLIQAMGDLGLFGITSPEEFGGADGDFTSACVAIEELGRVDQSVGITLEAGLGLGLHPILEHGSQEQKERWLPDLVAGRALAAFGLTEADSGSDAAALRTRAVRDGDDWVVDGSKQFITNSGTPITSCVVVAARTGTLPDGRPEISSLIVPNGTPGFVVEPAYDKLGWHAADTHPLTFDGCRVSADALLGEQGHGLRQFLSTLGEGRIALAALAVGCAQACLDMATVYALERQAFGRPIGAKQGVAFSIADLAVLTETARLLTYKAAWLKDVGRPTTQVKRAASMAKLHASEAAVTATRLATQVFGGYGFMEDYPVARFYRDAKVLEIGEGTSEVQRVLIGRSLGLPVE